jgi:hypothetical protein
MTDKTIDLDHHRGMAAQKATDLRRLLADVEANERALRARQDELNRAFETARSARSALRTVTRCCLAPPAKSR